MTIVGLVLFLLSYCTGFALYIWWQYERKQKLHSLSRQDVEIPSRQSRRYQRSSLFSLLSLSKNEDIESFRAFADRFSSISDVTNAMQMAGFDSCNIILGIDFSASNEWQGRWSFKRQCLHAILPRTQNPYQKVISIIGSTLEPFCQSGFIHAYGFGDVRTRDSGVFSFANDEYPCHGFSDILQRYNQAARSVQLSGPTNFAPILTKAIQIVEVSQQYHILVIISDGQMNGMKDELETVEALIEATFYPLSIIMIGVGDGPWDIMEEFDDHLPRRRFDNFQFVDYNKATNTPRKHAEAAFALHALMEIPDQYRAIKDLGYI